MELDCFVRALNHLRKTLAEEEYAFTEKEEIASDKAIATTGEEVTLFRFICILLHSL